MFNKPDPHDPTKQFVENVARTARGMMMIVDTLPQRTKQDYDNICFIRQTLCLLDNNACQIANSINRHEERIDSHRRKLARLNAAKAGA